MKSHSLWEKIALDSKLDPIKRLVEIERKDRDWQMLLGDKKDLKLKGKKDGQKKKA